jgi:hypothetical protein
MNIYIACNKMQEQKKMGKEGKVKEDGAWENRTPSNDTWNPLQGIIADPST